MKKLLLLSILLMSLGSISHAQQKDSSYLEKVGGTILKVTVIKDTALTGADSITTEQAEKILQMTSIEDTDIIFKPAKFPHGLFWIKEIPKITKRSSAISPTSRVPYLLTEYYNAPEREVRNTYSFFLLFSMLFWFFISYLENQSEYKKTGRVDHSSLRPISMSKFIGITVTAMIFEYCFGSMWSSNMKITVKEWFINTIPFFVFYAIFRIYFFVPWIKKRYLTLAQKKKKV